jgi:tetratricopeptide (TPR) repeat protein
VSPLLFWGFRSGSEAVNTIPKAGRHIARSDLLRDPSNRCPIRKMKQPPRAIQQQLAQAIGLLQQGQFAEAEAALLAILKRDSRNFDALHLAGVAAVEAGRLDEGIPRIRRAIAINPKNSAAHNNLGTALLRLDRHEEALTSLDRAVAINPQNAQAHHSRGSALGKLKRLDAAITAYDRAITLAPNYAEAYCDRGCAFAEKEDWNAALADQEKALSLNPHSAECLANLALALGHFKRFEKALVLSENALQRKPDSVVARTSNIMALIGVGRIAEALDGADGLIHLHPQMADGHLWRARALMLRAQPEAALAAAVAALDRDPKDPKARVIHGLALVALNRVEEALGSYESALKLDPEHVEAEINRGIARLLLGRFDAGWRDYERRNLRHQTQGARRYPEPLWLGQEALQDQRLFLYWEQGFGDTLQFGRYARLAAAAGARVTLSVQDPLRRLFAHFDPSVTVIGQNEEPAEFDMHCPLLSLPLAFGTGLETMPAWPDGYLKASGDDTWVWAQRLPAGRRRIGIVWSGNALHGNDANRSVPLEKLLPLFKSGDTWVSLQKDLRKADQVTLNASGIFDPSGQLGDFADTAALISALDLVIAVDTSVAHLAGALGKPVFLMLPFAPDFRWLLDRRDSPWYPRMRLFRQDRPGDWDGVVAQISAALDTSASPLHIRSSDLP